jgi:hypothetical protein
LFKPNFKTNFPLKIKSSSQFIENSKKLSTWQFILYFFGSLLKQTPERVASGPGWEAGPG